MLVDFPASQATEANILDKNLHVHSFLHFNDPLVMPCTCLGYPGGKNRRTDPQDAEELFVILSRKDILAQYRGMFRLRIVSVVLCFNFILEFFKQKFSVFVRLCCLSVQFS